MINATLLDGLEKVLSNSYIEQISPCKLEGDRLDVDIKQAVYAGTYALWGRLHWVMDYIVLCVPN